MTQKSQSETEPQQPAIDYEFRQLLDKRQLIFLTVAQQVLKSDQETDDLIMNWKSLGANPLQWQVKDVFEKIDKYIAAAVLVYDRCQEVG